MTTFKDIAHEYIIEQRKKKCRLASSNRCLIWNTLNREPTQLECVECFKKIREGLSVESK